VAQLQRRIHQTTNAINNTTDDEQSLTGSGGNVGRSASISGNRHSSSMSNPSATVKNITHQWGQHCLLWGVLFADPIMSTKALELYARIVKPCSMVRLFSCFFFFPSFEYVSSFRFISHSQETIIKLVSNLHICIQRLQTISTVSKAIQQGALSTGFLTAGTRPRETGFHIKTPFSSFVRFDLSDLPIFTL
jgi:hypothetical protein